MAKSELDLARSYLRKKQFSKVITLLEPKVTEYRDSFQFFYLLGLSCLYVNDTQGADSYFKAARRIKVNDVNLIMAQAVLYLKRGAIDKALEYCLDALNLDAKNKYVHNFLDLIKLHGDPDTISEWNHNGKLKKYYPPLPKKSPVIPIIVASASVIAVCAIVFCIIKFSHRGARLDPNEFAIKDKTEFLDKSLSSKTYRDIYTQNQAEDYYKKAQNCINDFDDNKAQMYINLILNSNCSPYVQAKARSMQEYLEVPTFTEMPKTNYSFKEVSQAVYKYENCYVIWTGRVTNIQSDENETFCTLLVGYEDFQKKEGDAPLVLSSSFAIRADKPIKVLAQIKMNAEGNLLLMGKSVHQPIEGDKL